MRNGLLISCLFLLGSTSACNGVGDCNELGGAVVTTFNLDFSRVDIKKQINSGVFTAMIVEYVNANVKGCSAGGIDTCPRPVKVVGNAPISQDEKRDLVKSGVITRIMTDGSAFKDLKEGFIRFSELGDVGDHAEGDFYGTFIDGITINGKFCGEVKQLGN